MEVELWRSLIQGTSGNQPPNPTEFDTKYEIHQNPCWCLRGFQSRVGDSATWHFENGVEDRLPMPVAVHSLCPFSAFNLSRRSPQSEGLEEMVLGNRVMLFMMAPTQSEGQFIAYKWIPHSSNTKILDSNTTLVLSNNWDETNQGVYKANYGLNTTNSKF